MGAVGVTFCWMARKQPAREGAGSVLAEKGLELEVGAERHDVGRPPAA